MGKFTTVSSLNHLSDPINLDACELLAEKLELEGDGLGEFVQHCMREVSKEVQVIALKKRIKRIEALKEPATTNKRVRQCF